MSPERLELRYRHWLIRCTAEDVAGGWRAVIEVWRPRRDWREQGEVVPFTNLFDKEADACVEGIEAAKRWIDARYNP